MLTKLSRLDVIKRKAFTELEIPNIECHDLCIRARGNIDLPSCYLDVLVKGLVDDQMTVIASENMHDNGKVAVVIIANVAFLVSGTSEESSPMSVAPACPLLIFGRLRAN